MEPKSCKLYFPNLICSRTFFFQEAEEAAAMEEFKMNNGDRFREEDEDEDEDEEEGEIPGKGPFK